MTKKKKKKSTFSVRHCFTRAFGSKDSVLKALSFCSSSESVSLVSFDGAITYLSLSLSAAAAASLFEFLKRREEEDGRIRWHLSYVICLYPLREEYGKSKSGVLVEREEAAEEVGWRRTATSTRLARQRLWIF